MASCILIVDDNELNLVLETDLLELHGHTVVQATSATEALSLARSQFPDLILMDTRLQEAQELPLLLKRDRRTSRIEVVALAPGRSQAGDKKAPDAGYATCIKTPIDTRAFPQQVAEILRSRNHD